MSGPRVKITYQDYLQLPEEQRYEVLEGVCAGYLPRGSCINRYSPSSTGSSAFSWSNRAWAVSTSHRWT